MIIKGWQKNSFVDYPGKIATTIFVAGCNFSCPYCHNGDLVLDHKDLDEIYEEEIIEFLVKNKKMIEGLCISGGEPTIYRDLPDFIRKIKEVNEELDIKLDTNGTNFEMLEHLINSGLLSYVAMDIKATPDKYYAAAGRDTLALDDIRKSVEILKEGKVPYEFRTTVVKELITEEDFKEIGMWLNGAEILYLQQFVKSDKQIKDGYSGYPNEKLFDFKKILENYIKKIEIRNT